MVPYLRYLDICSTKVLLGSVFELFWSATGFGFSVISAKKREAFYHIFIS